MSRSLTRGVVAAAVALLALPLLAAPAHAWTDRVETDHFPPGWTLNDQVVVPGVTQVTPGSTVGLRNGSNLDRGLGDMVLTPGSGGPAIRLPMRHRQHPQDSIVADAVLPGAMATGVYRGRASSSGSGGLHTARYDFTLSVVAGPPTAAEVVWWYQPATRRAYGSAMGVTALAGSRITYVAPTDNSYLSYQATTVKLGLPRADGRPGIGTPLSVGRVTRDYDVLSFQVPGAGPDGKPFTRRTTLQVVLTSRGRTAFDRGTVHQFGTLTVDPAGTRWYAPPGPPAGTTDTLPGQRGLRVGHSLTSANGRHRVVMQPDRNLVVYRVADGRALWSTGQHGAVVTELQQDGTLVQRSFSGRVVWSSGVAGARGRARLVMQDDGNLVVYRYGEALWASGTRG